MSVRKVKIGDKVRLNTGEGDGKTALVEVVDVYRGHRGTKVGLDVGEGRVEYILDYQIHPIPKGKYWEPADDRERGMVRFS